MATLPFAASAVGLGWDFIPSSGPGSAAFDISGKGLTFSDLNPGTTGSIAGNLGGIFGSLTIVPEPSALALVLVSGLALLPRLRQPGRRSTA